MLYLSSPVVEGSKCSPNKDFVQINTGVHFLLVSKQMSYNQHKLNCLKMGADGLAQVKTESEREGLKKLYQKAGEFYGLCFKSIMFYEIIH